MEHLTDSVFVNMANVTLLRRDSYLAYLKAGIKADTLAALRTPSLHLPTLFPDSVIKQAEEDITSYDKGRSGSVYKKVTTTLMNVQRATRITENRTGPLGRTSHMATTRGVKGNTNTPPDLQRASSLINDNHCITMLLGRLLAGSPSVPRQTMNFVKLNVNCHVAKPVHTVLGLSQKKELSPGLADCYLTENKLKSVKSASCVTQLSCVKPVTNVKHVDSNLPVGARLQNYWQTWLDLGAGLKAVQILKEGYTLPI